MRKRTLIVVLGCIALYVFPAFAQGGPATEEQTTALLTTLQAYPARIVYESHCTGNWDLFMMNADGTGVKNLTNSPDVNELYPHVSPDGTKVVFVVDEGEGDAAFRSIYYMNMDGTGRTLVAKHAREACWRADGKAIAYLGSENHVVETATGSLGEARVDDPRFTLMDYATNGVFIYDLETGEHRQHPNHGLHHLYNLCWSPDSKWFVATVHAGMGYNHTILLIEADGMKVFDLGIGGCRPDFSPDSKKLAWGRTDFDLHIADLDVSGPEPKILNEHPVAKSPEPMAIYHVDWSPDGKYIAFSSGPHEKRLGLPPEMIGCDAEGWNICVCPTTGTDPFVTLTHDGKSNKEPDWVATETTAK